MSLLPSKHCQGERKEQILLGYLPAWQPGDSAVMDFFDLKGILAALWERLHIHDPRYEPGEHPTYHPGKFARLLLDQQPLGVMGELHPLVRERYELPPSPLLAAELNLDLLLAAAPELYAIRPVPAYPPVLEDLAVVVDESLPAERVEQIIRSAGGGTLSGLRLFDIYRGVQIGAGKKSLAYSLTYQAIDRTLTDQDVARLRQRIIQRLEQEAGGRLRS
jgi:phenylalanyl-tRNA synthetase beta chain